jgi:hypothetical protein
MAEPKKSKDKTNTAGSTTNKPNILVIFGDDIGISVT